MTQQNGHARLASEGVFFQVTENGTPRHCLVSSNALAYLGRVHGGAASAASAISTYSTFESDIHAVARRLILAGERASPLVVGAAYFVGVKPVATVYAK